MELSKKKILIFTDWYYPGYRAGGPIQSCVNIVKSLNSKFDFYIITSDRDFGDKETYDSITAEKWSIGKYNEHVFYSNSNKINIFKLRNLIKRINPDTIYFNSMYSFRFMLLPLLAYRSLSFSRKIVLAPRGMLHEGAMKHKTKKKKIFLKYFKIFGFDKSLIFHATNSQEAHDIGQFFNRGRILVVENLPNIKIEQPTAIEKFSGRLKLVTISRIHPQKNLLFAIKLFKNISPESSVQFDIYGDIEDDSYFESCMEAVTKLPSNISIRFMGGIKNELVFSVLEQYHCFILPTFGENFCHAIFESLTCGRPVIISDQTPWKDLLNFQAGWVLSLNDPTSFLAAIQDTLSMDQHEYDAWVLGSRTFAEEFVKNLKYENKYNELFS